MSSVSKEPTLQSPIQQYLMRGWQHNILLVSLLIQHVGSRGSATQVFSPVSELGPSLAASVAGGTIIAARSPPRMQSKLHGDATSLTTVETNEILDDEECLVVLFRSPVVGGAGEKQQSGDGNLTISAVFRNQTYNDNHDDARNDQQHLSFLSNGPVNFPFLPSSSSNNVRILHAPSGLLVAATGFAPDADYILNLSAGRIFSRISVYDTPSFLSQSSTKSVDPHRLVREDISPMMMDATMSGGGRPFGVQLLVVGQSAQRSSNDCSLEIYTIDPSGGWRNCIGSGTAVGRGAERVRVRLRESQGFERDDADVEPTDVRQGWRGALDIAMMAAVEALEQDENSDTDSDPQCRSSRSMTNFGAIVVFHGTGKLRSYDSQSRCAIMNSIIIMESYDRCRKRLMEKQTLAKRKSV